MSMPKTMKLIMPTILLLTASKILCICIHLYAHTIYMCMCICIYNYTTVHTLMCRETERAAYFGL